MHVAVGVIMQLYCMARRAAGRLTSEYAQDIGNVAVYWHFVAITAAITAASALPATCGRLTSIALFFSRSPFSPFSVAAQPCFMSLNR